MLQTNNIFQYNNIRHTRDMYRLPLYDVSFNFNHYRDR